MQNTRDFSTRNKILKDKGKQEPNKVARIKFPLAQDIKRESATTDWQIMLPILYIMNFLMLGYIFLCVGKGFYYKIEKERNLKKERIVIHHSALFFPSPLSSNLTEYTDFQLIGKLLVQVLGVSLG